MLPSNLKKNEYQTELFSSIDNKNCEHMISLTKDLKNATLQKIEYYRRESENNRYYQINQIHKGRCRQADLIEYLDKIYPNLESHQVNVERMRVYVSAKLNTLFTLKKNNRYAKNYFELNFFIRKINKDDCINSIYGLSTRLSKYTNNKVGISFNLIGKENMIDNSIYRLSFQFSHNDTDNLDYIYETLKDELKSLNMEINDEDHKYVFYDSLRSMDNGWCLYDNDEDDLISEDDDTYDDSFFLEEPKKIIDLIEIKKLYGLEDNVNEPW